MQIKLLDSTIICVWCDAMRTFLALDVSDLLLLIWHIIIVVEIYAPLNMV